MKANSLQRKASPAAGGAPGPGLQRSASAKQAPSPSPLSASSSQYQSARASTSTTNAPAFPRHKPPSINCMAATSTDTPPATPRGTKQQQQPKSASSYYSSMFSPRKLMQRASRAFRGGRSSRRKKNAAAAADAGDVDSPRSVASKGSDAESSVFSLDDQIIDDVVDAGAASKQEEIVPEKIIHEANPPSPVIHQLAPVAEEQDEGRNNAPKKQDAAAEKGKEEEEPKKEAPPAPEDTVAEVDKIAAAKKQQREEDIKVEVVRRFQGCRVRTSMEKRSFDAETPRRRESARSNEAIEEARTKLLELRQVNKVKALVGAFETVMDDNHRQVSTGKPRLNLRV